MIKPERSVPTSEAFIELCREVELRTLTGGIILSFGQLARRWEPTWAGGFLLILSTILCLSVILRLAVGEGRYYHEYHPKKFLLRRFEEKEHLNSYVTLTFIGDLLILVLPLFIGSPGWLILWFGVCIIPDVVWQCLDGEGYGEKSNIKYQFLSQLTYLLVGFLLLLTGTIEYRFLDIKYVISIVFILLAFLLTIWGVSIDQNALRKLRDDAAGTS